MKLPTFFISRGRVDGEPPPLRRLVRDIFLIFFTFHAN